MRHLSVIKDVRRHSFEILEIGDGREFKNFIVL